MQVSNGNDGPGRFHYIYDLRKPWYLEHVNLENLAYLEVAKVIAHCFLTFEKHLQITTITQTDKEFTHLHDPPCDLPRKWRAVLPPLD